VSEELYSKSTHFILEFIQNADDNVYATNVIPTLRMCVNDREMSFHCNEMGFEAKNVEAICKVGASTKKGMGGYIGKSLINITVACQCFVPVSSLPTGEKGIGEPPEPSCFLY